MSLKGDLLTNITFISSYVPRKCGIATYTRDLAEEAVSKGNQVSIIAMENLEIPNFYSQPVLNIIRQQNKADYIKVAKIINDSPADIVHLQHEFGLFGGIDGSHILFLAQALTKPLIVTFHTVLQTPSPEQKKIIQELTRLSRKVIVMDKIGKDRLEHVYGLNSHDITIILHGAPTIVKANSKESKKIIGYPDKFIMLANNLLSRNKGIEYGIDAVAKALKDISNLLFLIVGETHPLVKAAEGESYRNGLIAQVKKLGLEKNVIFQNEYVSREALKTILSAADVYITPYLDPEQISSGALSYAIGASKACIATEYVYAKEMLKNDKGIIVPFRDSDSIAKALVELYINPDKKLQIEAKTDSISKDMSWSKVTDKHLGVYKKVLFEQDSLHGKVSEYINLPINISHLAYLTNTTGIVQHANAVFPDMKHGYSTCDNARALIVASHMFKIYQSDEFLRLIKVYSAFLNSAQERDGKFHTFLSSTNSWNDKSGVTDGFGRAVWGLGFNLYVVKDSLMEKPIRLLFEKSMEQFKNIIDLRSAAYSILGLYYFILAYKDEAKIVKPAITHLEKLAGFIKNSYHKNRQDGWEWFEQSITYDNFRIPQALFAVFLITGQLEFKDIAEASLKFITECNFDKKLGFYDFIGQDGWLGKSGEKANYDQQPLEAAGAVDANMFAFMALKDRAYLDEGNLAFEWFFGNNRNHRPIYDVNTKGVSDGLTLRGININQGAESVICFLIASLSLKENALTAIKSVQKQDFALTQHINAALTN